MAAGKVSGEEKLLPFRKGEQHVENALAGSGGKRFKPAAGDAQDGAQADQFF